MRRRTGSTISLSSVRRTIPCEQYFDLLIEPDTFYGNTERFRAAQREYMETPEATTEDRHVFVEMLTEQRRRLFFKIPDELAGELRLWDLSVFTSAGEYLLRSGRAAKERGARLPSNHRTPCEGAQSYLHRHAGGDRTRSPFGDQSLLLQVRGSVSFSRTASRSRRGEDEPRRSISLSETTSRLSTCICRTALFVHYASTSRATSS